MKPIKSIKQLMKSVGEVPHQPPPSNYRNHALLQSWEWWLDRYPWEAFLTVRWPKHLSDTHIHNRLKATHYSKIMDISRGRIGVVTVISMGEEVKHSHSLILPKHPDVIRKSLAAIQATLGNVITSDVRNSHKESVRYLSKHYVYEDSYIEVYGKNILDNADKPSRRLHAANLWTTQLAPISSDSEESDITF